jgi:hypothetical protein
VDLWSQVSLFLEVCNPGIGRLQRSLQLQTPIVVVVTMGRLRLELVLAFHKRTYPHIKRLLCAEAVALALKVFLLLLDVATLAIQAPLLVGKCCRW